MWLQAERAALGAPVLWLAVSLLGLWSVLVPQLPFSYAIDVGYEEGYGSDLPYLQGFNTAESDEHGTFRWTTDGAAITVPGLGQRPLAVSLLFYPISADVAERGPRTIELWSGNEQVAVLPVLATGARYVFAIPPRYLADGTLDLTLHTATFSPDGDPRRLGTPLGDVQITGLAPSTRFVAPDWQALGGWLVALVLVWLTLRHSLRDSPLRWSQGALITVTLLAALAALLDPPRWAFGTQAVLVAAALCYALTLVLRVTLPALAQRLDVPLAPTIGSWLTLISVLAFGLRYGGRLYPNSMHGDIGFHSNRFLDALGGTVFILSRNRGVDFPYPPGPYLLLAPFTLLGLDQQLVLELGAALVDAGSAVLVYILVARVGKPRVALLAAAIYVFTAAGFMTTWWSFDTHIYTQFFTLLAITALALACDAWQHGVPGVRLRWMCVIGVLFSWVFLGHFGFFINTTLLVGLVLGALLLLMWRRTPGARAVFWPLVGAFGVAFVFAVVYFYSAYLPLFLAQAQTAATGGLTELAGRTPVSRAALWATLWDAGIVAHFGFFPLALALFGFWPLFRLPRGRVLAAGLTPSLVLAGLVLGSFLVSAVFAVLPFITLSTQSTRWLMFSAWAVAVSSALLVDRLWRVGRSGKLVVAMMGSFVVWNTIIYWIGPMLWRIRPPEPF